LQSLLLGMMMAQMKALQGGVLAPPYGSMAAQLTGAGLSSAAGVARSVAAATAAVAGTDSAGGTPSAHVLEVVDAVQGNAITAKAVGTVPRLVQCWEKGWPLSVPEGHRVYMPKEGGGFDTKGLDKSDRTQLDLLKQGYLLVCAVSEQHSISMTAASAVVELWRQGKSAALQPGGDDPSVSAAATLQQEQQQQQQHEGEQLQQAGATGANVRQQQPAEGVEQLQPGTTVLHSLLPASAMSLDKLCKAARGLAIMQQRKDAKKREAGKLGGDTKRQRGSKAASEGSASR
jgi:hypothetical protein